jgi:hypothetical protein
MLSSMGRDSSSDYCLSSPCGFNCLLALLSRVFTDTVDHMLCLVTDHSAANCDAVSIRLHALQDSRGQHPAIARLCAESRCSNVHNYANVSHESMFVRAYVCPACVLNDMYV